MPEVEVPAWLSDVLRCPVCGEGLTLTVRDDGAVCLIAPAHTGTIRCADWETKVRHAWSLAVARVQTELNCDKALALAKKYLKLPRKDKQ